MLSYLARRGSLPGARTRSRRVTRPVARGIARGRAALPAATGSRTETTRRLSPRARTTWPIMSAIISSRGPAGGDGHGHASGGRSRQARATWPGIARGTHETAQRASATASLPRRTRCWPACPTTRRWSRRSPRRRPRARRRRHHLSPGQCRSPDQRFWLLRELRESLEKAVYRARLLVVVDDLQWAGAGSASALVTLSGRLATHRIGWLLALRRGELADAALDAAGRLEAAGASGIRLGPLG